MTRLRGRTGRAVFGLTVSLISLAIVFSQVDVKESAQILRTASWSWILVMLLFQAADVLLRALRWQRLVWPIKQVSFPPMLGYLLIGYLANNILPARLGELVRCHYLGDREGVSRATTLGTVVVERVVDTAVVVVIASVAILVLHVRGLVASAVLVGLAVTALLVFGLAVGLAAHRLPGAERVVAWAERWPRVREAAGRLRGGLAVAGRPRTLAEALFLSFLAWGATVVAFAAAAQALNVQLTTAQASLLAAGVALASAIPAGPSNLGTFDLAAVEIAATFGIDRETALALALLAHLSILITTSIGGAVSLLVLGWKPSQPVSAVGVAGTAGNARPAPETARLK
jgi:uncharacterized protein (TIRG00374 family)